MENSKDDMMVMSEIYEVEVCSRHDSTKGKLANHVPVAQQSPVYLGFTITLRHTTLGRTPLDE